MTFFDNFPASSKQQWRSQAVTDLKGKDFNETLVWKTEEGFEVEPYLTNEDLVPEKTQAIQAAQKTAIGWLNIPVMIYENEKNTSIQIKNATGNGADGIVLNLQNTDIQNVNLSLLLSSIKLSETPIVFHVSHSADLLINNLRKFIHYQMKGGVNYDLLSTLFLNNSLPDKFFDEQKSVIERSNDSPNFKTLCVDTSIFHNLGANTVQELAYGLSVAVTYLDRLTDLGLSVDIVISKIYFSVSVGTNYFMEVAKLRALRYLWSLVNGKSSGFGVQLPLTIQAVNSIFYDSSELPHTNMLRATTEAMSAVMGGCDMLSLHAYDEVLNTSNDFSERIARNVSSILSEESYLDKVADPAAGSYYIESLTQQLVTEAWALFLRVEEMGGYMAACEHGFIKQTIEAAHQLKKSNLESGKAVKIGVNKYREA